MGSNRQDFWKRHPGLVWSNPEAPDSAYIRAALLRPRFGRLLDIALEFGVEQLRREWQGCWPIRWSRLSVHVQPSNASSVISNKDSPWLQNETPGRWKAGADRINDGLVKSIHYASVVFNPTVSRFSEFNQRC